MMSLLPVALGGILASLIARYGSNEPASLLATLAASLALAPLGFLLATVAARIGAARVLRSDSAWNLRIYALLTRGTWVLLLAAYAIALDQFGGAALSRSLGPLAEGPAQLAPWVLACFAVWAGHDSGERAVIRGAGIAPGPRWRELRGRARRVLVPLAVFLLLAMALEAVSDMERVREALDLHPRARSFVFAGGIVALFALAPLILRVLFATRPIEVAGAPYPVRLWDLGDPIATAALCGLLPFFRRIFVTPRLVQTMEPHETAAVLRHELGHARLGHLQVLALATCALAVSLDDLAPLGLWSLAVFGALAVAFVVLARRLEHDADLFAAEGTEEGTLAVTTALLKCCAVNGQPPEGRGLRHPSVDDRIALLQRAAREPRASSRHLGRSRAILVALSVASAIAIGHAAIAAVREARSPVGERLLGAARERLDSREPVLARAYAERALVEGEGEKALALLSELERAAVSAR